jgi:hypothetical protein
MLFPYGYECHQFDVAVLTATPSTVVNSSTQHSGCQKYLATSTLKKKKRGYMVCTSDYVATNTRKTKEGCKRFSAKQAVTPRRPTPRKHL